MSSKVFKNIINDVSVELKRQIINNFKKESFYGQKWKSREPPAKHNILNKRGGTGLMGSIQVVPTGTSVRVSSNLPYAAIHNEGGKITVTAAMKKYFWAMHLKAKGGSEKYMRGKKKVALSKEAENWKYMALMKVGSTITIPKRQFVGEHSEVKRMIEEVMNDNLKDVENYIKSKLKRK